MRFFSGMCPAHRGLPRSAASALFQAERSRTTTPHTTSNNRAEIEQSCSPLRSFRGDGRSGTPSDADSPFNSFRESDLPMASTTALIFMPNLKPTPAPRACDGRLGELGNTLIFLAADALSTGIFRVRLRHKVLR